MKKRLRWFVLGVPVLFLLFLGKGLLKSKEIRDLQRFPQNPSAYLKLNEAVEPLVDSRIQAQIYKTFLNNYFAPWHRQSPFPLSTIIYRELSAYKKNPGYSELRQKRKPEAIQLIADNAQLDKFPNSKKICNQH